MACTVLLELLKHGSCDPALIMSTKLVNLSWCFLAATNPDKKSLNFQSIIFNWDGQTLQY